MTQRWYSVVRGVRLALIGQAGNQNQKVKFSGFLENISACELSWILN
jgi:hypothetical protein